MTKSSVLKWHGGKQYLAPKFWEIAKAVPHIHRVEPYCGGMAFTLASEPEGYSEVVNDLNWELTNFWTVLQHWQLFQPLIRYLEATPFSEAEFRAAAPASVYEQNREFTGDEQSAMVAAARDFFVRCRQSLAGRMTGFTGVTKTRTRRGMNNEVSAWLSAVEGLPAVHARLKRVLILNRPAIEVIEGQDGRQTLFYCDPPYLHETRATKGEYGAFEMTERDHAELLDTLLSCAGKVMLSGYPSQLYDSKLAAWNRRVFDMPNQASGKKKKDREQECLWMNF